MKYAPLAILILAGCVAAPSKEVVVLDESGRPISGAAPHPQVVNPFRPAKRSDNEGRLKVHRLNDSGSVKINAPGYEPSWLDYDHDTVVKLKAQIEQK